MAVNVASISKTFTAYAILKLYKKNKLLLSDPLSKWFENISQEKATITISELLSHTSALAGFLYNSGRF